jgi:DNA polymerase I-like protein with 3'-5' exonuclease and polymerase domains
VTQEINDKISRGEITEADRLRVFTELSWEKGQSIYETYHDRFPTLKTTSRRAGDVCRSRGFIFNVYGRRRHLPVKAAHNAFNTICQGGAMDFIKRRMIATSPRYWPELREAGITMRFNVHDAVGFHGPVDVLREWQPRIIQRLQEESPLRVPIFWDSEIVEGYWRRP